MLAEDRLDGELQVVHLLVGQPETRRESGDHEASSLEEAALAGQGEGDRVRRGRRCLTDSLSI